MRLRMLATTKGAEDGHTVREYIAGREYVIGGTLRANELAHVFMREGWAEEVRPPAPAPKEPSSLPASDIPVGDKPAKKKGR